MNTARARVPVTRRALTQRINRALKKDARMLKTPRGEARNELGNYYVLDLNRNRVVEKHVDVEAMGRALGVLQKFEALSSEPCAPK